MNLRLREEKHCQEGASVRRSSGFQFCKTIRLFHTCEQNFLMQKVVLRKITYHNPASEKFELE